MPDPNDFFAGLDSALERTQAAPAAQTRELVTLARELVLALDPEALLPAVADAVLRVVGGERVIMLTRTAANDFRHAFHRDAQGHDQPVPAQVVAAACEEAVVTGKIVFSYLPQSDTRWQRHEEPKRLQLLGFVAIPLLPERGEARVIYADGSSQFRAGLSEQSREVLELLAAHAALALDNARALAAVARDSTTELYHEAFFVRRVLEECSRASRYKRNVSLASVAIDRASDLAMEHGQSVLEQVARQVGAVVRNAVRTADAVAANGAARFWVLMPETPHQERYDRTSLQTLATRLHEAMGEHTFRVGERPIAVDVRIGVVSFMTPDKLETEVIMRDGTEALEQALSTGQDVFIQR